VHLGDPTEADDLTQDVLVMMIRRLEGFRGEAGFSTWLYSLTRNAAIDRRRGRERRGRLEEEGGRTSELLAGTPEDPSSALERRELSAVLRAFFVDLPPRQREAFELVELDGLSSAEAAARLGVAAVSVRAHVFKARRRLRSLILESRPDLLEELR
jgi:RNA polymerase sigma-70 factor (ECF subfamily)